MCVLCNVCVPVCVLVCVKQISFNECFCVCLWRYQSGHCSLVSSLRDEEIPRGITCTLKTASQSLTAEEHKHNAHFLIREKGELNMGWNRWEGKRENREVRWRTGELCAGIPSCVEMWKWKKKKIRIRIWHFIVAFFLVECLLIT